MPNPTFPPFPWIPQNGVRPAIIADGLLSVAYNSLSQFLVDPTAQQGDPDYLEVRSAPYNRHYIAHGQTPVFQPNWQGKQMMLSLQRIYIGRAGKQQFQFKEGNSGSYAATVGQYILELGAPWPTQSGGLTPQAVRSDQMQEAAADLMTDAHIVWSALLALSLGGVTPYPWPENAPRADEIIVGPMEAYDPRGGVAGWHCQIDVALGG